MIEIGYIVICIGCVILGFGLRKLWFTENFKGWEKRAKDSEKRLLDYLTKKKSWQDDAVKATDDFKDKLRSHPDAKDWMDDRPKSLDAFAATHKWQQEMEMKLKFGLHGGLDPYRQESPRTRSNGYIPNGIAPLNQYVQPKWDEAQVHDWQGFLNKELIRGTLDKFSCKICNDQGYVFVKHQIGTQTITTGDKAYEIPVYGQKEDGNWNDITKCECLKPKKEDE
jgi:hypothetical protein